jgi:hypothetical protein
MTSQPQTQSPSPTPARRLRRRLRAGAFLFASTLAACGSVPVRTLTIDAIDVDDRPVPCLVVVGDDWAGAEEKQQFVNVGSDNTLSLPLTFDRPELDVTVAAVVVEADGTPRRNLRSRKDSSDATGFIAEPRTIRSTDPVRHLFILRRR